MVPKLTVVLQAVPESAHRFLSPNHVNVAPPEDAKITTIQIQFLIQRDRDLSLYYLESNTG